MSIWPIPPVAEQPDTTLECWRAYEVKVASFEAPTRHLVGYAVHEREGRVTSAIAEIDATRCLVRTSSGRLYQLLGRPGSHPDADYVWSWWLRVNVATVLREVTDRLLVDGPGVHGDEATP